MTATEIANLLNSPCYVHLGKMRFRATIVDVANKYGVQRVLLEPDDGDGQEWKNLDTVTLLPKGGV